MIETASDLGNYENPQVNGLAKIEGVRVQIPLPD